MIPMETEGAGSWFAGLLKGGHSRTKSSEVTADSLQPALTWGKRSQILTLKVGLRANLTHTTCISPGHPTVDGPLIPGRVKELVGKEGVTFLL